MPTRRGETQKIRQVADLRMTAEALTKLKTELKRLLEKEQPVWIAEMQRTGMFGDFSENAEYQHAKGQLRRINDRIHWIEERLKHAVIITKGSTAVVGIGSTVHLIINGKEKTYRILGSHESNPAQGIISSSSPLGSAILGKRAGEEGTYRAGNATATFRVVAIR